jgi:hypothetical protein
LLIHGSFARHVTCVSIVPRYMNQGWSFFGVMKDMPFSITSMPLRPIFAVMWLMYLSHDEPKPRSGRM